MTMTMSANGQLTASDSRGCRLNGSVDVPDATHNLYHINATVTSCGSLDGTYSGLGTLLDADAMQGHNTVPTGQRNLLMFSMVNDHNAIMDALAR